MQDEAKHSEILLDPPIFKRFDYRKIFLIAFLLFGFYLRSYHLGYPSIGYHNMKENEYLSEAINHYNAGDYLRRITHLSGLDGGPGYFEEYPQMPILPWMILVMWKIFGIHFWAARIIIVAFSLASVAVMYLFAKKLTGNDYISLLSTFLMSYLPLAVFFGRNIQPEAPALFFFLLSSYLYLSWLEAPTPRCSLAFGLSLAFTALFKYTFLIILIPLLSLLPFQQMLSKDGLKLSLMSYLLPIVGFLPAPLWTVSSQFLNTKATLFEGTFPRVDLFNTFTSQYWNQHLPIIREYVLDNYTHWFFWAAGFGLLLGLFQYRTKLGRFVIFYALAVIPYMMVLGDYVKGHSYYQMPFLPLVAVSAAYFLYNSGVILKHSTGIRAAILIPLLIIPLSYPSVRASLDAQFGTIFYGQDVAADYLRENAAPDDRFYVATFNDQSYAVCFLSNRRCSRLPASYSMFVFGEENRSMRWIYVDLGSGGIKALSQDQQVFDYVQKNYGIAEIGFFQAAGQTILVHMLLKKGGVSNLSDLSQNEILKRLGTKAKTYDSPSGSLDYFVVH